MVVCFIQIATCVFLFVSVQSQYYFPYNQYGYQPYAQYPVYNPGYYPYPYASYQQYQPVVSSQPNYISPYSSQRPQIIPISQPIQINPNPYISRNLNSSINTQEDPYANIKTEIIDIEPKYFQYFKRYFNLEDNAYPIDVIRDGENVAPTYGTGRVSVSRPRYVIKTESKQTNYTSIPQQVINKHDVQTKTYTFKKTFTVDPTKKQDSRQVVNLVFVNGVQVTTEANKEESDDDIDETTIIPRITSTTPSTEKNVVTTTEDDEPDKKGRRYMDIPSSCPEGTSFGFSGDCFSPFKLTLSVTTARTSTTESTTTVVTTSSTSERPPRRPFHQDRFVGNNHRPNDRDPSHHGEPHPKDNHP